MSDLKDFVIEKGVLKKYVGQGGDVVVPDNVKKIGKDAFREGVWQTNTTVVSVTLPNSVKTIENNAFNNCVCLEKVVLPDKLSAIEGGAFLNCNNLKTINIPDSVSCIGTNAFSNCQKLANADGFVIIRDVLYDYYGNEKCVVVPNNVNVISNGAFRDNSSVQSIVLSDNIISIGYGAFDGCLNLKEITLPNKIQKIGFRTFCKCQSLCSIIIPDNVTEIDEQAFLSCGNLREVVLSNGVTKIGAEAFRYCDNLSSIVFTKNITKIGKECFAGCQSLCSVIMPDGVPDLEPNDMGVNDKIALYLFSEDTHNTQLDSECKKVVQRKREELFADALRKKSLIAVRKILSSYKTVKLDVLDEMISTSSEAGINEITALLVEYKAEKYNKEKIERIETNVIEKELGIKEKSFSDWRKIFKLSTDGDTVCIDGYKSDEPNVVIPEKMGKYTVTRIGFDAFKFNEHITSVSLPNTIEIIDDMAFYNCKSLQEIHMPDKIKKIGRSAFCDCKAITNIVIPEGIKRIEQYTFTRTNIKEIVIPKKVKEIWSSAFSDCENLEHVYIPDSIAEINGLAFSGCHKPTIHASAGSYAEQYAKRYNIPFVVE